MKPVLDKFRQVTALLQEEHSLDNIDLSKDLPFQNIATMLSNITDSNIYISDSEGVLVGIYELYTMNSSRFTSYLDNRQLPQYYIEYLQAIKKTDSNISPQQQSTIFPVENIEMYGEGTTTVVPIFVSGQRLGYLILARIGKLFEVEDLILAEYSATVVGIELLYFTNLKNKEQQRHQETINLAISSLSFSEKEAVRHIFSEINSIESRITASKIAKEYDITRSVIVNALRKLESAGLLETQSLGMKGTYIKFKNDYIQKRFKECILK